MTEERDTTIARSNIPDNVRERIWGRAAARCVLCSEWLIDSSEFWHSIPTGEIAHNVGAFQLCPVFFGPNTATGRENRLAIAETVLCELTGCGADKLFGRTAREKYSAEKLTFVRPFGLPTRV